MLIILFAFFLISPVPFTTMFFTLRQETPTDVTEDAVFTKVTVLLAPLLLAVALCNPDWPEVLTVASSILFAAETIATVVSNAPLASKAVPVDTIVEITETPASTSCFVIVPWFAPSLPPSNCLFSEVPTTFRSRLVKKFDIFPGGLSSTISSPSGSTNLTGLSAQ